MFQGRDAIKYHGDVGADNWLSLLPSRGVLLRPGYCFKKSLCLYFMLLQFGLSLVFGVCNCTLLRLPSNSFLIPCLRLDGWTMVLWHASSFPDIWAAKQNPSILSALYSMEEHYECFFFQDGGYSVYLWRIFCVWNPDFLVLREGVLPPDSVLCIPSLVIWKKICSPAPSHTPHSLHVPWASGRAISHHTRFRALQHNLLPSCKQWKW